MNKELLAKIISDASSNKGSRLRESVQTLLNTKLKAKLVEKMQLVKKNFLNK